MQPWAYSEPSRIDEILTRLALLRETIARMAKDQIDPKEAAAIAEAEKAKAQELFEALKKDVSDQQQGKK